MSQANTLTSAVEVHNGTVFMIRKIHTITRSLSPVVPTTTAHSSEGGNRIFQAHFHTYNALLVRMLHTMLDFQRPLRKAIIPQIEKLLLFILL